MPNVEPLTFSNSKTRLLMVTGDCSFDYVITENACKDPANFSHTYHTHTLELFMVAKWTVIIISLPQSSLRDKHLLTIQLKVRIFPEVFSSAIGVTTPSFVTLLCPALTLTPIQHTLSSTFYSA